jgi:1,2-dihydroxy-3-keto-5-methylthiopentene dioxygenase
MACVLIPDEGRRLEDPGAVRAFLEPFGIWNEIWPLAERVDPGAPAEAILGAYAPEIERLKALGGFVTADVIDVTPQTPNLEAILDRFRKEHIHTEDEVRFILRGRGLFHVNPVTSPVFALQVEAGDLINVPRGTRHWFDLCEERTIRAIRLFQDKTGWTPHYAEDGAHVRYAPVCWGPALVPGLGRVSTGLTV